VMPAEYTLVAAPEPLDERVKIAKVPARLVAALCFPAGLSESQFNKEKKGILKTLTEAKIKIEGNFFSVLYNPVHSGIPSQKRSWSRIRTDFMKPVTPLKSVFCFP